MSLLIQTLQQELMFPFKKEHAVLRMMRRIWIKSRENPCTPWYFFIFEQNKVEVEIKFNIFFYNSNRRVLIKMNLEAIYYIFQVINSENYLETFIYTFKSPSNIDKSDAERKRI